jgi:hypothetical protein
MQMCQNIVFGPDLQVDDDGVSDGGSDIDWQMQALQLSDEDDDEDLNGEDFFATDLHKYSNLDNYSNIPEASHSGSPFVYPSILPLPSSQTLLSPVVEE